MQGYLRHLANFAEIARSGSLGAAAERLNASVSGLSRSLSILEGHFGFPLMLRTARGVTLTEPGRLVLSEAETLVGAAHRALEVGRAATELAGAVVFSAPKEALQFWIADLLAKILREQPGLDLTILASDQVLDSKRQRVDVVLRIGRPGPAPDLKSLLEREVRPVLVAAADIAAGLPRGGGDLVANAPFLRFGPFGQDGTLSLSALSGRKQDCRVTFARRAVVSDASVAIELARSGGGVVGCLEPSVREDMRTGRLVAAFPGYGFGPATLRLGLTNGHQTPAAIAFARTLAERLGHWLSGTMEGL